MRHDEWLARIRVAAYLAVAVALVVAAALANGCASPATPSEPPAPSSTQAGPAPTAAPAATPGASPTSTLAAFDGTYGPGSFTRGVDSCIPGFFGGSYIASVLVTNNAGLESIFESQRRDSTCVFNQTALLATCSGKGVVGAEPATWDDFLQFSRDQANLVHLVVTETLRLTARGDCGTVYISSLLNRQ